MPKKSSLPIPVFLDTSVLKYSVDELTRLIKVADTIEWPDGTQWKMPQYRLGTVFPNEKLPRKQREETYNLPFFGHLARRGKLQLLCHTEVLWELMGLPKIDDRRGRFYGAPIAFVPPPFKYGRILAGPAWLDSPTGKYPDLKPTKRRTIEFFEKVKDPRFKELQIACGAFQGSRLAPNQLLDAFHIYCAEAAGAEYFLTADAALVRQIARHRRFPPKVMVVQPSELLRALLIRRPAMTLWEATRFAITQRYSGQRAPAA